MSRVNLNSVDLGPLHSRLYYSFWHPILWRNNRSHRKEVPKNIDWMRVNKLTIRRYVLVGMIWWVSQSLYRKRWWRRLRQLSRGVYHRVIFQRKRLDRCDRYINGLRSHVGYHIDDMFYRCFQWPRTLNSDANLHTKISTIYVVGIPRHHRDDL
jgi:hypothetical protein